jgi:hypothetical protein
VPLQLDAHEYYPSFFLMSLQASAIDTSNFDEEFTSEQPVDSVVDDSHLSETVQAQFQGFVLLFFIVFLLFFLWIDLFSSGIVADANLYRLFIDSSLGFRICRFSWSISGLNESEH